MILRAWFGSKIFFFQNSKKTIFKKIEFRTSYYHILDKNNFLDRDNNLFVFIIF